MPTTENETTTTTTGGSSSSRKEQRWFPLESNPSLLNEYVQKLGFNTDVYHFVDVYSTENWALSMIPQPVAAVLLLYPLNSEKQQLQIAQTNDEPTPPNPGDGVWFIKQRISNACGTIGLLHALLNAQLPPSPKSAKQQPEEASSSSIIRPDTWLSKFHASCPKSMDPVEKAEILENDKDIANLHDEATSSEQNQTSRGNIEDKVNTHFVALVMSDNNNNILYECDGRKSGPVPHGTTTSDTLLHDACKVIREQFMARNPDEIRFTILALAPKVVVEED